MQVDEECVIASFTPYQQTFSNTPFDFAVTSHAIMLSGF